MFEERWGLKRGAWRGTRSKNGGVENGGCFFFELGGAAALK